MADRHSHSTRHAYVYRYSRAPPGSSARRQIVSVEDGDDPNNYYHRHTSCWYLCTGCLVMSIGLLVYFAGGYLFVAYYNGSYPFTSYFPPYKAIAVKDLEILIYKWLGPIMFFIGLIVFCIGYATSCNGVRCGKQSR